MNVFAQTSVWMRSFFVVSPYKKLIFAYCLVIAAFDTWVQNLSVVAAVALGLAVLPWVLHMVEKISVPGGFEVTLTRAEQRIQAELPPEPVDEPQRQRHLFLDEYESDPQLALTALRFEIERRVRKLADDHGIMTGKRSMSALLFELERAGIIGPSVSSIIRDMTPTLNMAAHAQNVPADAGEWVIRNGPKLLAALDAKA